jgi:PhzF family phenazine biosynthesis protein
MGLAILQVDAFTDRPFAGNPAGVCVLEGPADPAWMQQVAREMNVAETAYLWPLAAEGSEEPGLRLRWFTPTVEIDLCGHGTLASAHVLWETGYLAPGEGARFATRSGALGARRLPDGWIELDFPRIDSAEGPVPEGLAAALDLKGAPRWAGRAGDDFLVEVGSEAELLSLAPDFRRLAALTSGSRGVIVTARPQRTGVDFVSRFFAPSAGIDEDPVTGSAHCALGPYWAARLGKAELVGFQASARGGLVRVRVGGHRAYLSGQAVTVLRGELV